VDGLKYDAAGLIPAIVQDARTGAVLMVAYMNREAVRRTLDSGETWFWSRSRRQFWHKGETSGNVQKVREVYYDCDRDTLLVKVEQKGAACHEGYFSCFHYRVYPGDGVTVVGERQFDPEKVYGKTAGTEGRQAVSPENVPGVGQPAAAGVEEKAGGSDVPGAMAAGPGAKGAPPEAAGGDGPRQSGPQVLADLYRIILARRESRPEGSYTARLFDRGLDKILKKVGEEATELVIGAKNANRREVIAEAADLLYHLLVLLAARGVAPEAVYAELAGRMTAAPAGR